MTGGDQYVRCVRESAPCASIPGGNLASDINDGERSGTQVIQVRGFTIGDSAVGLSASAKFD